MVYQVHVHGSRKGKFSITQLHAFEVEEINGTHTRDMTVVKLFVNIAGILMR